MRATIKPLLVIMTLFLFSCRTANHSKNLVANITSNLKPPFKTQGEQEKYWAQQIFKNEYSAQTYSKYKGKIEVISYKIIKFEKSEIVINSINPKYYLPIFEYGIFYPELLNTTDLKISQFEEVNYLSDTPKIKRFKFWVWYENRVNPQVYFIELTNKKALNSTDFREFCRNANLTFIKKAWINI
jgi:hypothetical protein